MPALVLERANCAIAVAAALREGIPRLAEGGSRGRAHALHGGRRSIEVVAAVARQVVVLEQRRAPRGRLRTTSHAAEAAAEAAELGRGLVHVNRARAVVSPPLWVGLVPAGQASEDHEVGCPTAFTLSSSSSFSYFTPNVMYSSATVRIRSDYHPSYLFSQLFSICEPIVIGSIIRNNFRREANRSENGPAALLDQVAFVSMERTPTAFLDESEMRRRQRYTTTTTTTTTAT